MTVPEIKLYNTRTRTKEVFAPIDPKDVRMYICGPTVYDRAHIGNARPVVVFDVLYRLLRHVYGEDYVTYVRNFTDVDDKINARAAQSGREIREITDETIGWYHEDMDALGALRPDREPRCTEYVPHMVTMIEELIVKGHAYPDGDGHVLFEVRTYDGYGTLARRSLDDMRAGARVEVATNKRDPMDFVLWKPSTEDQPGWDSPWGRGRPGWHIECSAMAREILGEVFDIHGGGIDLAFPHHENEMAQSCAAHGTDRMANVWMHNGYLMVEGEKMSKSLGNFFTVKDLRDKGVPGQVIRFVLLSAQYRQPLDWTDERATEAEKVLGRWFDLLDRYPNLEEGDLADDPLLEALCDDLNFPKALARLHELARAAGGDDRAAAAHLMTAIRLMGFDGAAWRAEEAAAAPTIDNPMVVFNRIGELLEARDNARKAKDFARSDEIRDAMIAAGLTITDTPKGAECEPCADFDPLKLMAIK